jgi:D-alanyl-D-alanine dipeptidase
MISQSRPLIRKKRKPATPKRLTQRAKTPVVFSGSCSLLFTSISGSIPLRYQLNRLIFKFKWYKFRWIMRKQFLRFTLPLLCFILCFSAPAQTGPPKEQNKREAHLVELTALDNSIKLDIRYATENNFVGKKVYPEARAFLQKPAAKAVVKVHKKLNMRGLGIVIFDGYRPWSITKLFWEVTSEDKRKFVANPEKGSKHNRGCAVDLSIFDLKTGELIEMPSGYDEFTERASPDYTGGTEKQRANRDMLRKLMENAGFTINPNEWWHFDYKDWEKYAIYDISFDDAAKMR